MKKREISPFQKPETKGKGPLVEEIERGDLVIQKYYVSEEETRDPSSEYYLNIFEQNRVNKRLEKNKQKDNYVQRKSTL